MVCVCVGGGASVLEGGVGAPVPPLDVLVGVGTAESGVGKWCVCVGVCVCASVLEGGVGAPVPPLDVLVGVGTAESGVGKWCVCVCGGGGGVCVSAGRRCWCSCASSGCVGGYRDS